MLAATTVRSVECTTEETAGINRFGVVGTIEITDKSMASGEMSLTTQMAGTNTAMSEPLVLSTLGTARKYAPRSLGAQEVTLVRLKALSSGRVYSLTIAAGLTGPQSTLTVQGIPFRAECKLK